MEPYPLRFIKNLNRGREIATVLLNYGFGDLFERIGLRKYLQWGKRLISRKNREISGDLTTPVRIRMALQDLGPTFVKFGQVLSTRPDLVPHDVIEELCKLQEDVPPFSSEMIHQRIEEELGKSAAELFKSFDDLPLAAGSLGQVHCAVARNGLPLAVKVLRPNVVHNVERDLSLMLELAQLMEKHIPESQVFDPVGLVNHFMRTIRREMNYHREARTIQEFARLFKNDNRLYVPRILEECSTSCVLTMEFIDGIRTDNREALIAAGIDPKRVAIDGANIFLKQMFEFGVFHGDPHPGNIRVRRDGSIALIDYGMVGFLDDAKRELLVDLLLAIVRNDVDRTVDLMLQIGQPSQPIERPLMHSDVRDFIETYYGVPLDQLNLGRLLNDFISILSNHGLRTPGDLMLMIRAIITLEGVGRQLDAEFNLANELGPYVEKLIRKRYDPKRIAERTVADIKILLKAAHDLPLHLGNTLKKVSQDDLKIQLEHRGLDKLINEFDRSSNRIVVGMVTSSLILSAAFIIRSVTQAPLWYAAPAFVLSGLLGLWLIWGILRSGRL